MSSASEAPKRILVAGTGAIGSVFACLLSEAGHDVTAFGRPSFAAAASLQGLRAEGIWGRHCSRALRASSSPQELGYGYDAVLVTCKSYQTPSLLAAIGDRAADDGVAISLQNGLGNAERIAACYGADRVMAGRVIFGAELVDPATVRVTVEAEPVLIGVPDGGADARADAWAATFDGAGIHCRATPAVLAALWGKVFYNAALNPLGALLGLTYGELAASAERRRIMDRVIEEAFAVARAEGVGLSWGSAADYLAQFYERLVPATRDHRSSMLQDIERGKPTEIDAICGEVCRRGEAAAVDVSTNRVLAVLVRARSAGNDPGDDRQRSAARRGSA